MKKSREKKMRRTVRSLAKRSKGLEPFRTRTANNNKHVRVVGCKQSQILNCNTKRYYSNVNKSTDPFFQDGVKPRFGRISSVQAKPPIQGIQRPIATPTSALFQALRQNVPTPSPKPPLSASQLPGQQQDTSPPQQTPRLESLLDQPPIQTGVPEASPLKVLESFSETLYSVWNTIFRNAPGFQPTDNPEQELPRPGDIPDGFAIPNPNYNGRIQQEYYNTMIYKMKIDTDSALKYYMERLPENQSLPRDAIENIEADARRTIIEDHRNISENERQEREQQAQSADSDRIYILQKIKDVVVRDRIGHLKSSFDDALRTSQIALDKSRIKELTEKMLGLWNFSILIDLLTRSMVKSKQEMASYFSDKVSSSSILGKNLINDLLMEKWIVMKLGDEKKLKELNLNYKVTAPPKYPVILCHGMGGDKPLLKYFRGVKDDLEAQGCKVYQPIVDRYSDVKIRAEQLKQQMDKIIAENPDLQKFNIIAHSMGGLDARYYISKLGGDSKIASLTTLSTPHRGSPWADFWIDSDNKVLTLDNVEKALPFISMKAARNLTRKHMNEVFNKEVTDVKDVKYFSYGGTIAAKHPSKSWRSNLVLWVPSYIIKELEGENDGLVSVSSAKWGEYLGTLEMDHADMINWGRTHDARAVYRKIVNDLRDRGF